MKKIFGVMLIGVVFAFTAFSANAATFVVNTTEDLPDANPGDGICASSTGFCSLRAAISEANALAGDDVITLPAGIYTQTLVAADEDNNAGGDWDIRSNLTINGAGADKTILQAAPTPGTATERVIESVLATNVVTINGVTLRHGQKTGAAGNATRGGGIRNVGTLTMNDCIVTSNISPGSGGIRNERTITLNNVVVSNNACINATANCFGGGMYNTLAANTSVVINNSQFIGNSSTTSGTNVYGFAAGVGIESSTGFNLTISNSSFTNNIGTGTSGSNGNGIRILATNVSTVNITNSSFNENSGVGGASIQGSGIQVFTSGTGTLSGTFDGVTVNGNSAMTGAGIAMVATGGAMNLNIINSTISNNAASSNAGGVVMSNSGATTGANSVVNFINTTISGNATNGNGGGVFLEQPAASGSFTANFNFSTIANNTANIDNIGVGNGGGIFRSTAGTLNLKNSVVADNSVGTGGTGPDISGTVNSQDYNHIEDLAGATITGTTTNNSTGDAQLGPLANNGGPTMTHLPADASPVVNAIPDGTNDCGTVVKTDQRGIERPSSGACEKGSVEISVSAGTAFIEGRVLTARGRAISNAAVTISGGGLPSPITVYTGAFGRFRFNDLPTGQTYTLSVEAGKISFGSSTRNINLTGNRTNEDFIADGDPFAQR
jgi:CSLREA domain-containing protein